jgi:FRG domain
MSSAWYQFLDQIREAESRVKNRDNIWYRGHKKAKYKLVPSLFRSLAVDKTDERALLTEKDQALVRDKEHALLGDFVRLGGRDFIKHVFKASDDLDEDWSTLFDMQHYEVPTRLLDWTLTLGVAIAFAVMDREETNESAAVYVLDPAALNKRAKINDEIIEIRKDGFFKYKELYWEGKHWGIPEKPVAIAPPKGYWNERMAKQYSAFTVHGSDKRGIEKIFPEVVTKVVLPAVALNGAREFLTHAHILEVDIYPDVAGLARYIQRKHFRVNANKLHMQKRQQRREPNAAQLHRRKR